MKMRCPKCKTELKVTMKDLKRSRGVACKCSATVRIDGGRVVRMIEQKKRILRKKKIKVKP